jgi:hypothetical protein
MNQEHPEEPFVIAFSSSSSPTFGILGNIVPYPPTEKDEANDQFSTLQPHQLVLAYTLKQGHGSVGSIGSKKRTWYAKLLYISGLQQEHSTSPIVLSASFVKPHLTLAGNATGSSSKAVQDPQFLGIYDTSTSSIQVNEYVPIESSGKQLHPIGSITLQALLPSSSPICIKPEPSQLLILIQFVPQSHLPTPPSHYG